MSGYFINGVNLDDIFELRAGRTPLGPLTGFKVNGVDLNDRYLSATHPSGVPFSSGAFYVNGVDIGSSLSEKIDSYIITISSNTTSINMRTMFEAMHGVPVGGEQVTFQVLSGVRVGSAQEGLTVGNTFAIETGSWPVSTTLGLAIDSSAYVVGAGGNGAGGNGGGLRGNDGNHGGSAIRATRALNITNLGTIAAGGGGGGAANGNTGATIPQPEAGGGGGAGYPAGSAGASFNYDNATTLASSGTLTSGGNGANVSSGGSSTFRSSLGGSGGSLGNTGSSGSWGTGSDGTLGNGGSAGRAIVGNSFINFSVSGTIIGGVDP
jgi:hypothetical protein